MLDIKSLPKEPEEAVSRVVEHLLELIPDSPKLFGEYRKSSRPQALKIMNLIKMASIACQRASSEFLRESGRDALFFKDDEQLQQIAIRMGVFQDSLFAAQFDSHFIAAEDDAQFDQVSLSNSDKDQIRGHLAKARKLTDGAEFLTEHHKKRILFRIAKVENELYKEVAGFQAFLAAASDASSLVRKFGKDAQPLADAIQTVRTVTERKLDGSVQIEKDADPKQLPAPDNNAS